MSNDWLRLLSKERRLGKRDLRVGLVLYHFARCSGSENRYLTSGRWIAWPGLATMTAECGIDRRNLRRSLRKLEESGLLGTQWRTGTTSHYRLLLPHETPAPRPQRSNSDTEIPPPANAKAARDRDAGRRFSARVEKIIESSTGRERWVRLREVYAEAPDDTVRLLRAENFTWPEMERGLGVKLDSERYEPSSVHQWSETESDR